MKAPVSPRSRDHAAERASSVPTLGTPQSPLKSNAIAVATFSPPTRAFKTWNEAARRRSRNPGGTPTIPQVLGPVRLTRARPPPAKGGASTRAIPIARVDVPSTSHAARSPVASPRRSRAPTRRTVRHRPSHTRSPSHRARRHGLQPEVPCKQRVVVDRSLWSGREDRYRATLQAVHDSTTGYARVLRPGCDERGRSHERRGPRRSASVKT